LRDFKHCPHSRLTDGEVSLTVRLWRPFSCETLSIVHTVGSQTVKSVLRSGCGGPYSCETLSIVHTVGSQTTVKSVLRSGCGGPYSCETLSIVNTVGGEVSLTVRLWRPLQLRDIKHCPHSRLTDGGEVSLTVRLWRPLQLRDFKHCPHSRLTDGGEVSLTVRLWRPFSCETLSIVHTVGSQTAVKSVLRSAARKIPDTG
jgi:hypothetical protein